MLLSVTTRGVVHEAIMSDLGQVLRLLLGNFTTRSLASILQVLCRLIVVHVGMVARLALHLGLTGAASLLLNGAVLAVEVVLELDGLRHILLEIAGAASNIRIAICGASARERGMGVYAGADRSISHHLAASICVFSIEASTDAALEHLISRILNLVARIALLIDDILLEFQMVAILTGQTVNHVLLERNLLTHGALALLGVDTLHHHFVRLLAHLLVVWVAARIHHGARQKLRAA